MKNVMKATATAAIVALALGGFSLAVVQPAIATGSTAPETSPTVRQDVGAYLYKKKDESKPAAWENSGTQDLLDVKESSTQWFAAAEIMSMLPADVCGPGWAIQQDKLDIDTTTAFKWPKTIEYPDSFGEGATLTDDRHDDLETYGPVPDCDPEPEPSPTPDPKPTPEPSPSPAPDPKPSPTPEPSPSPTPDPKPTPEPKPDAGAQPQPHAGAQIDAGPGAEPDAGAQPKLDASCRSGTPEADTVCSGRSRATAGHRS